MHFIRVPCPVLSCIDLIQSDASPHKSLWGFGEGDTGEGGGESALSRREVASFASVWTVDGWVTGKRQKLQERGFFLSPTAREWVILRPSVPPPPPQNLCKQLHSKIDVVDEERYDCESKVSKHNKDVSLNTLQLIFFQSSCTAESIYVHPFF